MGERRLMLELVMAQLDGGTWRMADHRGQVVLVNYLWATWSWPCWEEMLGLVRLSRELGPKGLLWWGSRSMRVAGEGAGSLWRSFTVLPGDAPGQDCRRWSMGWQVVPTTILVDKRVGWRRLMWGR